MIFGTPRFDPFSVANDNPFGAFFASNRWTFYHENTTVPVSLAESYNVFVQHPGNGAFIHQAMPAMTSGWATRIEHFILNDQPNRIVLVNRNRNGGSAIYNPHLLGVFYFAFGGPGYWHIANIDTVGVGPMPIGIGFNIYTQEPSPNAFVVTASSGNTSGSTVRLDHPLLNGTSCAKVHVSRVLD